jgi:hypothetical protein
MREGAKEFLESQGVPFPSGTSAWKHSSGRPKAVEFEANGNKENEENGRHQKHQKAGKRPDSASPPTEAAATTSDWTNGPMLD